MSPVECLKKLQEAQDLTEDHNRAPDEDAEVGLVGNGGQEVCHLVIELAWGEEGDQLQGSHPDRDAATNEEEERSLILAVNFVVVLRKIIIFYWRLRDVIQTISDKLTYD